MNYTEEEIDIVIELTILDIVIELTILQEQIKEIERDWNLGKISNFEKRNKIILETKKFIEKIKDDKLHK